MSDPTPPTSDGLIRTYTGLWVDPLNLHPSDICIRDIAHALSMLCRYTGHARWFYSVAEHCCIISDLCRSHHKLWGLLHDATEAYLNDLSSPVKCRLSSYLEAEEQAEIAVVSRYGLRPRIIPAEVKELDHRIYADEARTVCDYQVNGVAPLGCQFKVWSPREAEEEFLGRFVSLM